MGRVQADGCQLYARRALGGRDEVYVGKMVRFALDAITSFSYLSLQLASYAGFVIALISGVAIVAVIALRLFGAAQPLPGQATTLVAVLFSAACN